MRLELPRRLPRRTVIGGPSRVHRRSIESMPRWGSQGPSKPHRESFSMDIPARPTIPPRADPTAVPSAPARGARPRRGTRCCPDSSACAAPEMSSRRPTTAARRGAYRVFSCKRVFLAKSSETPSVKPSARTSNCGRTVEELQERAQELVAYISRGDPQVGAQKISSCQERHGANRDDG